MKCPVCGGALVEKVAGGITVDLCDGGCGGIWFDQNELQRLDDADEAAGEELLAVSRDPAIQVDHQKKRNCPRCADVVMMRHFYSAKKQVAVDQCAGCGGFWLDAGELQSIRAQYQTESERENAHEEDARAINQELEVLQSEDAAKAEKVRGMFRFLRPSYYITGK